MVSLSLSKKCEKRLGNGNLDDPQSSDDALYEHDDTPNKFSVLSNGFTVPGCDLVRESFRLKYLVLASPFYRILCYSSCDDDQYF